MSITKLKQKLREKNIELALFYNIDAENYNKNMYYFSGYKGIGCLIILEKKPAFLIVPLMEYERASKSGKLKVFKWEKGKRLFEQLKETLKNKKIIPKRVGIVYRDFSYDVYKSLRKFIRKVKIQDIENFCLDLRTQKTDEEIKIIKRCCSIGAEILAKCINNFNKFKTEKDVEIFLHSETIKMGCELAFPPIVASGKAGSMAHYIPRNIKLRKGFCVIDFGVRYGGYNSDITRTLYLGNPSEKEKKMYNLLLNVQSDLIKKIKVNKKCSELYEETNILLKEYSENFIHGLGHGLGLDIHELPNLKSLSKERFKNNMVFTVEPGIYFENKFGIRIEDDILIKNNKTIILTKVPKKLIIKKR